jgi:methionine-rich copper-binding protein CopC
LRTLLAVVIAAATLLLPFAENAIAHARLDQSQPAVDATLAEPPAEVRVWFTQELTLSRNEMAVYDVDGVQVDNGDTHVDQSDPNRKQLVVSLPWLSPGAYQVAYTSSSAEDGDLATDSYWFTVGG